MNIKPAIGIIIILLVAAVASTITLAAAPNIPIGPDSITTDYSTRKQVNTPVVIAAEAGNVTAMTIETSRQTLGWAGYFGNITGAIVLDDANNYTFYSWALEKPTGQVYASNGTVTWDNVYCVNLSATGNPETNYDRMNETTIEEFYGMNFSDHDGFSETFNQTYAGHFYVGDITISDQNVCPMAYMYVNQAWQTNYFKEVLLTDNNSVIFTGLLEDSKQGYLPGADSTSDFQMLVAEDGHPFKESTLTDYYFYVEVQ